MPPSKRQRDVSQDYHKSKSNKKTYDVDLTRERQRDEGNAASEEKPTNSRKIKSREKPDEISDTDTDASGKSFHMGEELSDDDGENDDKSATESQAEHDAKRYITEALDFAVDSGYLKPDSSYKVLHVSSKLANYKYNAGQSDKYTRSSSCETHDDEDDVQDKVSRKRSRSKSKSTGRRRKSQKRAKRSKSRSRTIDQDSKLKRKNSQKNDHVTEGNYKEKTRGSNQKDDETHNEKSNTRSTKTKPPTKESSSTRKKDNKPDTDDEDDENVTDDDNYKNSYIN